MTISKWIQKKKKDNKKFYGYTGPVKPEKKSKWISKKSDNKSYGYTKIVKQKKEPTTWITKKKKEEKDSNESLGGWIKKKVKEENN